MHRLDRERREAASLRGSWEVIAASTPRRVVVWMAAIVLLAAVVHIVWLSVWASAPTVFDDELGYQQLAKSLGETGQLALFGKQGLSYSPLYPAVLAPFYALHLSATAAYRGILVVNCLLMALASVPLYRIARFVLSPGRALVAVALSALAPLMLFSSVVMSENLAYPLFLFAVWAILAAVRSPSVRADVVALVLCGICTAARLQFFVLVPAALGAVLLLVLFRHRKGEGRPRDELAHALRAHVLLTAANVVMFIGVIAAYAGSGIVGLAGQYANQRTVPAPYPWRLGHLFAEHVAGLELSFGVIPFVGTLVATWVWYRHRGKRPSTDAFAAVAVCVSAGVMAITIVAAYGQLFPRGADLPRIHERYYFYLLPLFVIGLVATVGLVRSEELLRVGLVAAVVATLLPLLIPFGTVINRTAGIDAFGLVIFSETNKHGHTGAIRNALLIAMLVAACLAFVYALARPQPAIVLTLLAVVFLWVSVSERSDQANASRVAAHRSFSAARNWVDAADAGHAVPLIENPHPFLGGLAIAETAFFNRSVARLYYPCSPFLYAVFGETHVVVGRNGVLLVDGTPIRGALAVVPAGQGIAGRVIASDGRSRLELIQPTGGILRLMGPTRGWTCPKPG
jgi:hypothetical protein